MRTRPAGDPATAVATLGDQFDALRHARGSAPALVRASLGPLPSLRSNLRLLARLPVLTLELGESPAARQIASAYVGRRRGVPRGTAVAVLGLPEAPGDYLRGRHRQALRTNCTRARAAGLAYEVPRSEERVREIIRQATEGRARAAAERVVLHDRVGDSFGEFRSVVDRAGAAVALLQFTTEGPVARINWGMSQNGEAGSAARYLIAAETFAELAGRGIRHVLAESDIVATPGVRYFHARLGFEPHNIRLRRGRPTASPVVIRSAN